MTFPRIAWRTWGLARAQISALEYVEQVLPWWAVTPECNFSPSPKRYLSVSDCIVVNPHFRVDVFQVPLKTSALKALSERHPFGDISIVNSRILRMQGYINTGILLCRLYVQFHYLKNTHCSFNLQADSSMRVSPPQVPPSPLSLCK